MSQTKKQEEIRNLVNELKINVDNIYMRVNTGEQIVVNYQKTHSEIVLQFKKIRKKIKLLQKLNGGASANR